jgi:cell division protein FtsI (penicillin-binding protein 3)
MMKPLIVKAIYYNDHTEVIQPEVVGRPISAETAQYGYGYA